MCALSDRVRLCYVSSERAVELPEVIQHETMHPQSVRVGRDPGERCAMYLFREIEETSQVFPSRREPGETSN